MNQIRRGRGPGPWEAGLTIALTALVVWPALALIIQAVRGLSLGESVGGLMDASLASLKARPAGLLLETLRVTLGAEALALPLGVLLAVVVLRTDLAGRRLIAAGLGLSLFIPMPLHATAWLGAIGNAGRLQALGSQPLLAGWLGASFVHAMAAVPWVALILVGGLRASESECEDAALLEMPGMSVARRVTLRRAIGSLVVAAVAVAVMTATDMTVTDLLQVRTYAEEAYLQAQLGDGPAAAARVTLPPLAILGALILALEASRARLLPVHMASVRLTGRVWRLGSWRWPLGIAALAVMSALLLVPLYGLIWRAGRVSGRAASGLPPHWSLAGLVGTLVRAWPDLAEPTVILSSPLRSPLMSTALWAGVAATITVFLAWSLAWKGRWQLAWEVVAGVTIAVLLATPAPVVGLALKLGYIRLPLIHDTGMIVVMAYVVRTLPFALLVLWPSVRGVPDDHISSARLEGYGAASMAWHVASSLTRPAILAAWVIAFVLSMGELPASNIVLPAGSMTIATRLWMLLHTGVESHLAGVALILLLLYATLSLAATWGLGRAAEP